jgi:peroxiredoxin|tara:strand:+ start:199 stop:462 length:264 start_codon:yes stop_codon:yes gene_type:complete
MEKNNYGQKSDMVNITNENGNIEAYEIEDIEIHQIDPNDAPDFCNASICSAMIRKFNGEWRKATDKEINEIMQDTDLFCQKLEDAIY